ncbi:MAG: hypothetical protein RXR03_08300 [Thermocladium sp.]
MYENNQNGMEGFIYGKVLRETRNLALVRIDFTNGALTAYLIVEKENHIEEEYHKIYDKFFTGIFGAGNTEEQAFISAYNNRYAMRDEEIYKEIEELENEENNEVENVVYGIPLWETKNLVLVIINLNEDLLLYLVIQKPNPILQYGRIVGIGNTEYRAFVSAYKHTTYLREREEYEEVKELEGMAFGW